MIISRLGEKPGPWRAMEMGKRSSRDFSDQKDFRGSIDGRARLRSLHCQSAIDHEMDPEE